MKRAEDAGNTGDRNIKERPRTHGLALCATIPRICHWASLISDGRGGDLCTPLSSGPLGGGGGRPCHWLTDTGGCCYGMAEGTGP